MLLRMNHLRNRYFSLVLILLLSLVFTKRIYAVVYAPGTTLDPGCAPTEVDCSVIPPLTIPSLASSGLFIGSNGIGIGTTSLTEKLTLYGGNLEVIDGDIRTNNIIARGNIGIGITNPGVALHIKSSDSSSGSSAFKIENSDDLLGMRVNDDTSVEMGYSVKIIAPNQSMGTASLTIKSASGNNSQLIFGDGDNNRWMIRNIASGNSLDFYNFNNSSSALRVLSDGKVGIGTTSPGYLLDVGGTLNANNLHSRSLTSDGTLTLDSRTTGAVNIGTGLNSKTINIGNTIALTGLSFYAGSGNILFQRGLFTINTTTNRVGIGTANPGVSLSLGDQKYPSKSFYIHEDSRLRVARGLGNGLSEVAGKNELSIFTSDGDERDGAITFGILDSHEVYKPKMIINTSGLVGISTMEPRHLLDMGRSGGFYDETSGRWIDGSDRSYKSDIFDLTKYGLDTIAKLRPVSYKLKSSGLPQIGFIAQEVDDIIPEVVYGEDGRMGLSYGGLVPILVKAIQEQQTEITELKETNLNKKGMEMIDQINGDIYCTYILNGEWKKEKKTCNEIDTVVPSPTLTPTPTDEPVSVTPTPTAIIEPTVSATSSAE